MAPQARMKADVVSIRTCFCILDLLRDTLRSFNPTSDIVPRLPARLAARDPQYLWRIRLRRQLAWRRLDGARRYRRRPGKPLVSARSLAGPDAVRRLAAT